MSLTYEDLSAYLKPEKQSIPSTQDLFSSMAEFGEYVGVAPSRRFEGGTRFDRNLTEGTDQQEMRGQLQPGIEKLARGFLGRGASVLPKFIQGMGHVGGLAIGQPFDNALVREMSEMDESFRKDVLGIDTRVFNRRVAEEGSLARQFFTPEFWANDVFDGLAFLASAIIPGGAIGKAGSLAKGAKAMRLGKALGANMKGVKLGNAVKEVGKLTGKMTPQQMLAYDKLSQGLTKLTVHGTAAYNTISEAGFEAHETGKNLRENLAVERFGVHFEDLTPTQQQAIKEEVAPRQVETFLMNAAVLAGPNYIQSKWFFGKPKTSSKLLKDAFLKGDLKADDVAGMLGKTFVGSLGKNVGKNVLAGIGSEGIWEEGIQSAIQNYETRKGTAATDDNLLTGVIRDYINGFTVKDSQKAMLIGAIIGGGSGAFGGVREYRDKKREINSSQDYYKKLIQNMEDIRKGYVSDLGRFVKRVDPQTGEPEYDQDAIFKTALNGVNDIRNFTEATVASIKEDDIHIGMVNREALSKLAFDHFTNPFYDTLDEAERAIMNDLDFTAASAENPEYVKAIAEEHKATVKELRKLYEAVDSSLPTMEDVVFDQEGTFKEDYERSEFLDLVRTNMYYEGVKAGYLTESAKGVREEFKPGFESVIKDATDRMGLLKNRNERTKLLKAYREYRDTLSSAKKVLEDKESKEEDRLTAQYHINKEAYLMGQNSPDTSRFFPGSQSMETRAGRKIPVRNRVHATIARQQLTKSKIKDLGQQFQNGEIEADQLVNGISQGFEYFTPSILAEVDKVMPLVEQRYMEMLQSEQELNAQIEEAEETMHPSLGKLYMQKDMVAAKMESIRSAIEGLQTMATTSQGSMRDVSNMVRHYEGKTLDIFEEAVYAANFTDNNGTSIPEQAAKLLTQMDKDNPEDRTADLLLLKKVQNEIQNQIRVFSMEPKNGLLSNDIFNLEVSEQLERSMAAVAHQIAFNQPYIDVLNQINERLTKLEESVRKNKGNRQVFQRESYRVESEVKFAGLGIAPDGSIADQEFVTQLQGVIGTDKFNTILEEAKKNGMDGLYADVLVELYKRGASEASMTKLESMIESYRNSKVDYFVSSTGNREEIIREYTINPEGRLRSILWGENNNPGIFKPEDFRDPKKPAYKFDKTRSLYELIKTTEADTTVTKEEREKAIRFLNEHKAMTGKKRLLDAINSTATMEKKVGIDKSALPEMKSKNLYPSAQQHNAIRSFVTFFTRQDLNADDMSALAYMPGEAGTGKTTVVLARTLAHLGLKKEQIVTTASNSNAISTMDNVTGAKGLTFDQVLAASMDGIKLIVVDEAGALSSEHFDKLVDKLKKHNAGKSPSDMVRVIMIGDPNQIGADLKGYPKVTNYHGEFGTITQIPALTVPYRTDVSAITEFANEFKDNTSEVNNIYATASTSIEEFSNKTVGVHVGARDSIVDLATKAAAMDGSTAIIVESEQAKGAYMSKVPSNVELLTFKEAQGRTLTRVFIDLSQAKIQDASNTRLDPYDMNRVMYTAITRASLYAFVANNKGSFNQSINKDLGEDKQARAEDLEKMGEWFTEQVRKEEALVSTYLKGKKDKVRDVVEPEQEEEEDSKPDPEPEVNTDPEKQEEEEDEQLNRDPEIPQEEDPDPEEEVDPETEFQDEPDTTPEHHNLKYVEVDVDTNRMKPEGKVKYVRFRDDKDNVRLLVMAETLSGKYIKVGEVGKQEAGSLPAQLADDMNRNQNAETANIIRRGEEYDESYFQSGVFSEGRMLYNRPLKYFYGAQYTQGKGVISELISKWVKGFNTNVDAFIPTLKIYDNKEIESLRSKYPEFSHMKPGVPYLLLSPKNNDGKIQYIELRSMPLSMEVDNMAELRDFMDSMYEAESLFGKESGIKLGNPLFNKAIKAFKNNFTIQKINGIPTVVFSENNVTLSDLQEYIPDLTEAQFQALEQLSHRFIPLFYGEGKKYLRMPEDEAKSRYQDTDQDEFDFRGPDKNGNVLVMTRKKGESKFKVVQTMGMVAGLGKAQGMLKDIAKRHPGFAFADGTKLRWIRKSAESQSEARVKSLLSEEDGALNAYNTHLKEVFRRIAEEHVDQEIDDLKEELAQGKISQALYNAELTKKNKWKNRIKFVRAEGIEKYLRKMGYEDVLEQEKAAITSNSITLEKLEEIFSFNQDGTHPTLEQNIRRGAFNILGQDVQANESKLEPLIRSRYSHTIPAKVVVEFPERVQTTGEQTIDPLSENTVDVDGAEVADTFEDFFQRDITVRMSAEQMASLPMMQEITKRNIKDYNICF